MAFSGTRVSVGTSATAIATQGALRGFGAAVVCNRGVNPVYLGGADVTTASGFQLDPGEAMPVDFGDGDALYGIVAAATESVHVLQRS